MTATPGALRVAHFSDTWVPRRDGVVTALQTLTTAMEEFGHESLVVVPRHHDQPVADSLLRLPSLPCGIAQFRLGAWPRDRHVARVARWRPNILHVHTPGPIGLLGVFAARTLELPLVLTYHTDLCAYADAYRLPPHVLAGILRAYAHKLGVPVPRKDHSWSPKVYRRTVVDAATRLLYGSADTVIVPTEAVLRRSGVSEWFPRLRVVPTGVSLPPVRPCARRSFRSRYGIPADAPMVLFVGRLNREKGIDLLTAAFGRLAREVPEARLVLVGSANESRWVDKLLHHSGVGDRAVRTGQLSPFEVAEAYAAADVFAFPSRTDTQGLVVQEAALAGLPIVLADPSLHQTGPLAHVGILAHDDPTTFAAALTHLVRNPKAARTLGERARAQALRNTPHAYAQTMTSAYTETAANYWRSAHLLTA